MVTSHPETVLKILVVFRLKLLHGVEERLASRLVVVFLRTVVGVLVGLQVVALDVGVIHVRINIFIVLQRQ